VGAACVVATEEGAAPGLGRPPILIFGPGRRGRGPPPMFSLLLLHIVFYNKQASNKYVKTYEYQAIKLWTNFWMDLF
jgi:hypothetical protein